MASTAIGRGEEELPKRLKNILKLVNYKANNEHFL